MLMRHSNGLSQRVAVCDITTRTPRDRRHLADLVYSDPPWNPGNEKYWRTHAAANPSRGYDGFLDAWCREVIAYDPRDVLVEQSANWEHANMLLAAIERNPCWRWPLLEHWEIQYGHPRRPNRLLHFGTRRLSIDPTGMNGEAMTRRVFEGLGVVAGETVADPCTGLGTTSRVAHSFGANFIGTEINPARAARTIKWLTGHGYQEVGND